MRRRIVVLVALCILTLSVLVGCTPAPTSQVGSSSAASSSNPTHSQDATAALVGRWNGLSPAVTNGGTRWTLSLNDDGTGQANPVGLTSWRITGPDRLMVERNTLGVGVYRATYSYRLGRDRLTLTFVSDDSIGRAGAGPDRPWFTQGRAKVIYRRSGQ